MEVHPRLFDLTEVVREVAALMGRASPRRTSGSTSTCRPGLPRALADPARVRQIVTNLVSNAHLYTGEGGRITVTLDRVEDGLELPWPTAAAGMSQEEIDQAFDRFVRRDDGGSGTGLGLSIVKSLVDLQGGLDRRDQPSPARARVHRPAARRAATRRWRRGAARARSGASACWWWTTSPRRRADRGQARAVEVEAEIAHERRGGASSGCARAASTLSRSTPDDGRHERPRRAARAARRRGAAPHLPVVVVSILSEHEALFGEWKVTKPIDSEELADALGSAVLAGRTRVLVVGALGGPAAARAGAGAARARPRVGHERHGGGAGLPASGGSRSRSWTPTCATPRTPCARSTCAAAAPARPCWCSRPAGERGEGAGQHGRQGRADRGGGGGGDADAQPGRAPTRTGDRPLTFRAEREDAMGKALAGHAEAGRGDASRCALSSRTSAASPRRRSASSSATRPTCATRSSRSASARRSCAPRTSPRCAR